MDDGLRRVCECGGTRLLASPTAYYVNGAEGVVTEIPAGMLKVMQTLPKDPSVAADHATEIQTLCNVMSGAVSPDDFEVIAGMATSLSW